MVTLNNKMNIKAFEIICICIYKVSHHIVLLAADHSLFPQVAF